MKYRVRVVIESDSERMQVLLEDVPRDVVDDALAVLRAHPSQDGLYEVIDKRWMRTLRRAERKGKT